MQVAQHECYGTSSLHKPVANSASAQLPNAASRVIGWVGHIWSGWSTQILVGFSLALQVVLLLLAGVRRHKEGGALIDILWGVYQLADYTTTYALGNIAASSALHDHQLVALWAPFLLLHLAGPDNIAAYELEDNKLWSRHLLTLLAQALGAGYAMYKHFSIGGGTFYSLAAIFMAVVGFVKSCEKIWVLRHASLSVIRGSVRAETSAKCTFFLDYEPPRPRGGIFNGDTAQEEEFYKKHAHALFHVCKSAMVDSSVDDDDPNISNHGAAARLLKGFTEEGAWYKGFKEHDTAYKWTLMEMELSLMYDILYTKAAMVHTLLGYCIRVASSLAVAVFLLLFWFSGKAGYSRVDVFVTYALLSGALLLETTSLLTALFSTWTFAFLCTTEWSRLRHALLCSGRWDRLRRVVVFLHRLAYITGVADCIRLSRRWHGTMGQCSMLDICTRWDTATPLPGMLARMLGSSSWTVNVPVTVKEHVVNHINNIQKSGAFNTLGVIRTDWGHVALINHSLGHLADRYLGAEVQEAIVIWHIATDIILMKLGKLRAKHTETEADVKAETIKAISHYMMFLLVERPSMLPGLAQIKLYQRTEKTLLEEWNGAVNESATTVSLSPARWIHAIWTMVVEQWHGGPNSDSRLQRRGQLAERLLKHKIIDDEYGIKSRVRFGIYLAQKLIKREEDDEKDSLQVLLDVWTDILVYTANKCSRESHAKQLSKGGEFTTLIWLMAEHLYQAN
ncbi:unnamed protein product [Urochloa decumbens]|uniref:DUF4220 domain-containing protein n=1 Tax=Urochloa decumbens TaxID=240449 RepID=A0ABC8ZSJ8_9POAL